MKLTRKEIEYLIAVLEGFYEPDEEYEFKEVLIGKLENLKTEELSP